MYRSPKLNSQIQAHLEPADSLPATLRALLDHVDTTYGELEGKHQELAEQVHEADQQLARAQEALLSLAHRHPDLILCLSAEGLVTCAASETSDALARFGAQSVGKPLADLCPEIYERAAQGPAEQVAEFRSRVNLGLGHDGHESEYIEVDVHVEALSHDGRLLILRDASSGANARRELEQSHALLRAALESTADGILVLDRDGEVTDFNERFAVFWDLPEDALRSGRVLRMVREQLVRPATFTETLHYQLADPTPGEATEHQLTFETKDGRFFELVTKPQVISRATVGSVWSFRDITERHHSAKALEFIAYHDPLTNLPNRRMFLDRLEQAIAQSRRLETKLLVAFVDLDRFKQINDSLGHQIGDQFLQEVATRLVQRTRTEDTVARLAGDEFAILINNVNSQRAIPVVAEGIQSVLADPVRLHGQELAINASVGLALFPDDAESAEEIVARADSAMYAAKASGGSSYRLYQSDMHRESLERLRLENELRTAIQSDELLLHYQPQISLADDVVTGTEALVRWERGDTTVYPGDFIPIAEESGLIRNLGDWVLKQATVDATSWGADLAPLRVAVNISALQLRHPAFVQDIGRALASSGLQPAHLEIELTESSIMEDPANAIRMFHELRDMGVKIAIDDFGTGYSSFSHLKQLPINKLKIDKSFVSRCESDSENQAILRSLVAMAHGLGIKVLAEGVETQEEAAFLRDCLCDEAQGYFFGRPMRLEDFRARFVEPNAKSA